MVDMFPHDQEQQVKKLKRLLEGWRVALLPLKSVMLWEQQWHPCALFGCITSLYVIICLLDLNFLTTISLFGLIINFIDFVVPVVCNSITNPNSWTGQKEKMFEDMCRSFVVHYNTVLQHVKSFYSLRETSPIMYFVISISSFLLLAWIGMTVDNTFLLYILSVVLVLWPGLQNKGIFKSVLAKTNFSKAKQLKSE